MKKVVKRTAKESTVRVQRFVAKHFSKFIEVPKLTAQWVSIAKYHVDPSTLGVFGLAIGTMEVEVLAAIHPRTGEPAIILDYSYKFVDRGSNGYRQIIENV